MLEHRLILLCKDLYNGWKSISCHMYSPTNIHRRGLFYITILKLLSVSKISKYIFTLKLNNTVSLNNSDILFLDIILKSNIIYSRLFITKYPSIILTMLHPNLVLQLVEDSCKYLLVTRLESLLDSVDMIIDKFLDLYNNSKI